MLSLGPTFKKKAFLFRYQQKSVQNFSKFIKFFRFCFAFNLLSQLFITQPNQKWLCQIVSFLFFSFIDFLSLFFSLLSFPKHTHTHTHIHTHTFSTIILPSLSFLLGIHGPLKFWLIHTHFHHHPHTYTKPLSLNVCVCVCVCLLVSLTFSLFRTHTLRNKPIHF